ncbi:hypothetical protein LOT_0568 [Lentilactobacillus otakiensis DSM 19908 = JCM 15040]|uniref:Uncharacterized protein n=1 Tax=Lentilactobacillus otakiensis DSM 19908 = JCM 15040 TaxID=1423780 RepID=S4PNQ7_9LACO|nr:hypothetical protein LOT_0568 [Lentilactobacillus otakiensis DSM 19908 = JCM 15040]
MKNLPSAFYFIYQKILVLMMNRLSHIKETWLAFIQHAVQHY